MSLKQTLRFSGSVEFWSMRLTIFPSSASLFIFARLTRNSHILPGFSQENFPLFIFMALNFFMVDILICCEGSNELHLAGLELAQRLVLSEQALTK